MIVKWKHATRHIPGTGVLANGDCIELPDDAAISFIEQGLADAIVEETESFDLDEEE